MNSVSVEERLDRLERQVGEVMSQLSVAGSRKKDWRRTIGMFDDDPLMDQIIQGALKARQDERLASRTGSDGDS